jgi:hypothetical protein
MFRKTLAAGCASLLGAVAFAHGDHDHDASKGARPPPLAVLQLDEARDAASQYFDVDDAVAAGYADIGVFMPQLGWHYLNEALLNDGKFDWRKPELLVYADDPCTGKRRLVAVEYAVPLPMAKRAP